jgi:pimeloyl-[acyl-carrier protein] methyl ester esterase
MTRIYAETYGSGPPLAMLHGWAMHSGVWRDFAMRLAQRYRVICLDLPGHGRSSMCNAADLDEICEVLIRAIPERSCHLLGWSLGGTLAMAMAERFPERVDKVVVLAGNPKFVQAEDWPGIKPDTLEAFADLLKTDVQQTLTRFLALQVNGLPRGKALLPTLKQALQECPAPADAALAAGLQVLKSADLRNFLLQNRVPTVLIFGGKDTLIPVCCATLLQRLNPRLQVRVLASAGHLPFLTHTDELVELIVNNL